MIKQNIYTEEDWSNFISALEKVAIYDNHMESSSTLDYPEKYPCIAVANMISELDYEKNVVRGYWQLEFIYPEELEELQELLV